MMMPDFLWTLLAAAGLGMLGSGHCIGMCGGIVSALTFSSSQTSRISRWQFNLGYNLGRICSYALMGGLIAGLAAEVPDTSLPIARTLAAFILISMGMHIAGWWRGILHLEKLGAYIWRWIKPLGDRLLPVDSVGKALGVGMVWGWLPCGLVYAALGYAIVQEGSSEGALTMAAFGLGTLPALFLSGALASKFKSLLQKQYSRTILALGYIVFGIWTLVAAWYHPLVHQNHHEHEAHHDHSSEMLVPKKEPHSHHH
jgi:sulfite exporter TauE/SafE